MRRKPRLKVNEGPFVSEYFEQQDIQAVGLTHALDVAPLRNELEDVEVELFSWVEIHMEMDMEWKWMEMGHYLLKSYGLDWIWGRLST